MFVDTSSETCTVVVAMLGVIIVALSLGSAVVSFAIWHSFRVTVPKPPTEADIRRAVQDRVSRIYPFNSQLVNPRAGVLTI